MLASEATQEGSDQPRGAQGKADWPQRQAVSDHALQKENDIERDGE